MTDDDLDRHLRDILRIAMGFADAEAWLTMNTHKTVQRARDRLRLAIDAAVLAERETCKAIAVACARERANAANDAPVVGPPERTQVHQWLRCKQSEAERIAELIANRSNTP